MSKVTEFFRDNLGVFGYVIAAVGTMVAFIGGEVNGADKTNEAWCNAWNDTVGAKVASHEKKGLFGSEITFDLDKLHEEYEKAKSVQEAAESEKTEEATE